MSTVRCACAELCRTSRQTSEHESSLGAAADQAEIRTGGAGIEEGMPGATELVMQYAGPGLLPAIPVERAAAGSRCQ